ncbi:hypothetical protein Tco_1505755 [Tanacetum coccineum]
MSVKYPNYVNLTYSSEEQPNERTPSPPPRKKSLSPPQASLKSISSKSTHYTSSSSPRGELVFVLEGELVLFMEGLPSDVYSLVNHYRVAKDIWERVQLLMQVFHMNGFQQQFSPSQSPQYGSIHPTQHYSTTYPSTPHAITYPSTAHPNAYSSTGSQSSFAAGTSGTRANISGIAQRSGKVLNEEELEFLADPGVVEVLMEILSSYGSNVFSEYLLETQNAAIQDTNSSTQQDAMILSVFEQLSNQVTNYNKVNKDNLIANESLSAELERYKERVKLLEERQNVDLSTREKLIMDDIIQEKNAQFASFEKEINYLKQTISKQSKEKELLTKTFNVFKNESKEKEAKNIDKEIALENKFKESDNITLMLEEESQSKMLLKPSDPKVLEKKVNIKPINYVELNRLSKDFGKRFVPQQELSDEQAFRLQTSHPNTDQSASLLVKVEAPWELPKVSMVNTSLKKLKYHLGQFDNVLKKQIMPDTLTEGEWGFEHTKAVFLKEIISFVKTLKDIFNVFNKDILNEVTKVQTVFNQIEAAVQQYHIDKQCFDTTQNHHGSKDNPSKFTHTIRS